MSKTKESKQQREVRVTASNNGITMRTRVVPNKKKKKRIKHVDWENELEEK